jgi:selenide,water dikinase
MGGRPLTALSIAAFPEKDFPPAWAAAIVRGGPGKLREAGCVLLGGHSVRDPEIKFGYAVTGTVDPDRMFTNANGVAGDVVFLTKPLGTGVIATALKAGRAPAAVVDAAAASMAFLNAAAAEAAARHGVRAATDVTGFGLAGHASAVARESRLTLEIEADALPLLEGARDLAIRNAPAGLRANQRQFGAGVEDAAGLDEALTNLLYDPQTSGGLLLLVAAEHAEAFARELPSAARIGRAVERGTHLLRIVGNP